MIRVQNNGLGVQSTTLFIMAHEGLIEPVDYSVFADTQEEPAAVYEHLTWMRTLPAPVPIILVGTAGKLGDDLVKGCDHRGNKKTKPGADGSTRFASIPAFMAEHHETRIVTGKRVDEGMVRRQCTKEYKVDVVERIIRYQILGLKYRQRIPKGTSIVQLFGISWDEKGRAERISRTFDKLPWAVPQFPLIEQKMTREDCKDYLKSRVPHEVPRSACVFCPYKQASEWKKTKDSQKEWSRAVEVDRSLRLESSIVKHTLYLHRNCIPLEMVDIEDEIKKEEARKKRPLFELAPLLDDCSEPDCGMGMCGV